MAQRIHDLQQSLEQAASKEQSVMKRIALTPALFFVFFIHAIVYSTSILFLSKEKSFQHVHNMHPDEARSEHVESHHQWTKRVRVGSAASLVASVAITSAIVSAFSGGLPTLAATDCSLDIDVEASPVDVDAYISAQGGCDNLTVTTGGATTEATLEFVDSEVDLNSGGTFTVDSGVTIVFSGALNYPSGDVVIDGTLTHAAEDSTGVSISAENITNNGAVQVSEKGCQAIVGQTASGPDSSGACVTGTNAQGAANGSVSTGGGSGASHGGYGGESTREPRDSYDSNFVPALLGASGASVDRNTPSQGGHGGGLVALTATDTITNAGSIAANAGDAERASGSGGSTLYSASAGSGGAIYLNAPTIDSSNGSLNANGGAGGTNVTGGGGGGGGGGRIALDYSVSGSIDSGNTRAVGGLGGSSNSTTQVAEDGQNGSVVLIDQANDSYEIYSGFTFGITGENIGTEADPIDSLYIDSNVEGMHCYINATDVDIHVDTLNWNGTVDCGNGQMSSFDIYGTQSLSFGNTTALNMEDADMLLGLYSPSDLTLDGVDITMAGGGYLDVQPYNTDTISLTVAGDSTITANMASINVLDSVTIEPSATLSASGVGCPASTIGQGGFAPDENNACSFASDGVGGGQTTGDAAGGGGYGGNGGDGDTGAGGVAYGSQWRPLFFGSSGGNSNDNRAARFIAFGGDAAGAILLQTNTLSLTGTLLADGNDGNVGVLSGNSGETGGGGSGGSIHLSAASCDVSSASFSSAGGDGQTGSQGNSGGGAGGRVRVACADSDNSLTAATDASGGAAPTNSGDDGTAIGDQLDVPYVFIAFPTPDAHNVDVNPTVRALEFDANGGWPTDDRLWEIANSEGTVVYTATTDPETTSLDVTTDNGTFADGATSLQKEANYTLTVTDTNHRGAGSASHAFTTVYEDATLATELTYNWPYDDSGNYSFTSGVVDIAGDSIARLVDLGSATYTSGNYTDVEVDASTLAIGADFWFEMSEALGGANGGEVRYQIGNDSDGDGSNEWYYVDYSAFEADYDPSIVPSWVEATGAPSEANTNTAQEMDYYAPDWTTDAGKSGPLTIRAYLLSDGTQPVEVDTTTVVVTNNDQDGDGYNSVDAGGEDCDDTDASVNPDAEEAWYDGVDQNCDGADDYDQDGDGFVPDEYDGDSDLPGGDCNDTDATVYPGAEDVYYDGVDSNCDGASDYDADGDGFDSDSFGGDDCDDSDATINPDAEEVYYDGVDQNCDGESDFDADEDGYDSDSYGGDDCDDSDADINPGADDALVDGIDQDCDGQDGPDEDGDGFGPDNAGGNDCNDADASIYPGAPEIIDDGIDQDCDGVDGEGQDNDGDGFAGEDVGGVDCNDNDPLVFPASPDGTRNAVDENCDGVDGPFIVDHVTGTKSGAGIVTVYAPDNSIHYTYEAFKKRGVYPVLLEYQDRYFVASVHWRYGRILKVHELRAPELGAEELLDQRRISRTRKRRRMAFGLLGRSENPHIVFSTIRGNIRTGQTRRLKVLRFRPNRTKVLRRVRVRNYRVRRARKKIGNRIIIVENQYVVIKLRQGGRYRTVFVWNPKLK